MWAATAASVVTSQAAATSADSQSLQIAFLSFAGAVIGVVGVIYSNWRKKSAAEHPAIDTSPLHVLAIAAEVDDLKSSMERHRRDNDDRFDDIDGRVRRNSNRIGDLEDRADRGERHARWADSEAGRPSNRSDKRQPGDPPATRDQHEDT